MAKKISLLVNSNNPEVDQPVFIEPGMGDKGWPVRVKAVKGARYYLADPETNLAPKHIQLKRVGNNLHIILEGSTEADFIVLDYYDNAMLQGKPKGVFGYGDDGALHEYVTADSRMAADTIHLADGDPAVNKVLSSDSVDGYFELSGVFLAPAVAGLGTTGAVAAAAGAAAAAAAAAGSSSQNNNASTPPAPIAATGALADASDTGTKGDNRTTITTPTITGKAPAGAVVEVTLNGKTYTTTADANGNYSVTVANTQPLEVGRYTPTIKTTTATGSTTSNGTAFDVEADSNAGSNTNNSVPVFSSAAAATAVAENTNSGAVVYTAVASSTASTVRYSLKAGTGDAAKFSIDPITGAVTLTESPNYEAKTSYSFTVVATDGANRTSEKAVTLGVTNVDEVAPTLSAGATATATAIAENTTLGAVVYTAVATDSDFNNPATASSIAYSLKAGTGDVTKFSINTSTGAVTLAESLDFETKPNYSFTVVATDAAGKFSEQVVSLGVTNVDEVAPVIISGDTASVLENAVPTTVVYTATATDADYAPQGALSISYSLKGTGDDAMFSINSSTGAVTLNASADFESKPSYSFTVVATDAAGKFSEQVVTLGVTNVDDTAPTFSSGAVATAIVENSLPGRMVYTAAATDTDFISPNTANSVSYSLKGTGDDAMFSINSGTGVVTLTEPPDFETKPSYSFTVIATDAVGNAREKVVSLAVTNVDEVPPTFTSGTAASVLENAAPSTLVYTATAIDSDYAQGALQISYSLDATGDGNLFSINSSTGEVTFNMSADYETQSSYSFTVVATDAANRASHKAVTLAVTNVDEVAPTMEPVSTASVFENSAPGTVVITVSASDTDFGPQGPNIIYSLKQVADYSAFSMNSSTGEVSIVGVANYENKSSYSFTVIATDAGGNSCEQAVTLGVINIDEVAPVFSSGGSASVAESTVAGSVVYTAVATDIDYEPDLAPSTSYSIKEVGDHSLFSINSATGEVRFNAVADYETQPNQSYSFTVVATDVAGNPTPQAVTLAVTDVDESTPSVYVLSAGANLDLSAVSGPCLSAVDMATDTASNTLTLNLADVLGATPSISSLVPGAPSHTLLLTGGVNDYVVLDTASGWVTSDTVNLMGHDYAVYVPAMPFSNAQVLIDLAMVNAGNVTM